MLRKLSSLLMQGKPELKIQHKLVFKIKIIGLVFLPHCFFTFLK